jgi:hypothetical protein
MRVAAALSPVRDFFLLEKPFRAVAAYTHDQHTRVAELCAAGDARVRVARSTTPEVAVCLLLRDAVESFARAHAAARDAGLDAGALSRKDCTSEVPSLTPDPLDGSQDHTALVSRALAADDPLYLDRLDPAELARLHMALERAARAMRRGVEARSRLHLHVLRWARVAAVALLVLVGAWLVVRARRPKNIAVGKPVKVSSYLVNPPDGQELATGRLGFTYSVHTNIEDSPNVVIDLQGEYAIDSVEVFNRADGWFDDCLPLVVEVSRDGGTYVELSRREEYFGFDKPWVVSANGQTARFVRARVARRNSYLALGRLRVFGRKP